MPTIHQILPLSKWCILTVLLISVCCLQTIAQVTDTTEVKTDTTEVQADSVEVQADSIQVQADSTGLLPARSDTIPAAQDSLGNSQGPASINSGELQEGEVRFQGTDSLVFNFENDRIADLFGSAKVDHNSGKLESGNVTLNLDQNRITARTLTPQDTLSQPVLTREGEPPVRSHKIAFNYETERGRFEVARVKIDRGKVTGTRLKNTSPHVVYIEDAIYSTCTLDHPHYYISADRAKVVKRENRNEIFFKNARLYILDIPYPLVFPFGYFPGNIVDRRQSGLLKPSYVFQNTSQRGLGLRNLGWFQYFNDYITGQAAVDIFTSGTFYLDASADYRNRGSYSGSVQIGYSRERGLEPTDPNFSVQTAKSISIRHSQEFSPYADLSANINLETSNFDQRNSYDIDERVERSTRSNINYNYRHPENVYSFSANISQNQNFFTNVARLNGPSFDFSLRQFNPFASDQTNSQNEKWYESLSVRYSNSFESNYRFDPIRGDSARVNWFEALLDPSKYREATDDNEHYKYGFQQDASVSVNNLLDSQYLNLSADVDYTEYWYPTTTRRSFNPDSNEVEVRQVRGFASAREFSTGLNFSTTFYGISNAKIGTIEGFRHTVRPNLSFRYQPDFSSDLFGYFREVVQNNSGSIEDIRTREYSIFENEVFGGPRGGEQRSVNFGIGNVFEAKQVKRDSTGEKSENVIRIIDQLNASSSYNFAADSLKLADLNVSMNSSVIDGLNLRANANFNFYDRDSTGTLIDKFLLTEERKLAELTDFSLNASTSFSGGADGGVQVNQDPYFPARYDPLNQSIFNTMDSNFNRRPVQPIKSLWSVSINFRYSWRLDTDGEGGDTRASINARNIEFNLTPKWSFGTQIGYDFIQKELTPSEFRLNRQLHNWTLSFQMNPFGEFQYYFFSLRLNSSQLQSIFQKLPLLKNLERSSSPTGRGMGGGYGGGYGGY